MESAADDCVRRRSSSQETCAICLVTSESVTFLDLACGHKYHPFCVARAFRHKNECPLCRRSFADQHNFVGDYHGFSVYTRSKSECPFSAVTSRENGTTTTTTRAAAAGTTSRRTSPRHLSFQNLRKEAFPMDQLECRYCGAKITRTDFVMLRCLHIYHVTCASVMADGTMDDSHRMGVIVRTRCCENCCIELCPDDRRRISILRYCL